jgi:hypothetical protein
MPSLCTPRILAAAIDVVPSPSGAGKLAPTNAVGAFIPAATFGAPHTMLSR